jgi:hypothetical protein
MLDCFVEVDGIIWWFQTKFQIRSFPRNIQANWLDKTQMDNLEYFVEVDGIIMWPSLLNRDTILCYILYMHDC